MLKFASTLRSVLLWMLFIVVSGQTAHSADWPQWRGPRRDAVSHETGLLKQWSAGGPPVAWRVETAGVGYSSVAVKDGRVITQGDLDGVEHIIAFSEKDGRRLWAVQPRPVAEAQRAQARAHFKRYDKNSDGRLDEFEALAGLGWNFNRFDTVSPGDIHAIADKRVKAFFARFDRDRDGRLTRSEAPRAMGREFSRIDRPDRNANKQTLAEQRADTLLKRADKNSDGTITRREARGLPLARMFRRIDRRDPKTRRGDGKLTRDEIRSYFLKREPGRDGQITLAELAAYYADRFPGRDGILTPDDLMRFNGGYRNGQGDGPRGTPTIDGNRVYTEGGNGDVTCLDAATGRTLWHVNLVKTLGGRRPGWGYSESPLVTGNLLIVTPGGSQGTLAALNKQTGEVVWRSADQRQAAHYSSPQSAEIAGIRQIVQFSRKSLYGVSLDDGHLLWSYRGANNGTANVATPIIDGNRVLASSAYGTGAGLVKISANGPGKQNAEEVYFQKRLANHHGGLVKVGDDVYGFSGGLVCMNFATGKIVWRARSVGKGSLICADGMLYCLGERYQVALVMATPAGYRERGRFSIENLGRPSWAHPAIANGRLYIRNLHRLTAYDIRAPR